MSSSVAIDFLSPADRAAWDPLIRCYMRDYERMDVSDEGYDRAWQRLLARQDVFGLAARVDGRLVGIAHYFFHTSVWADRVCYLQDLFTAETARGQGVGRALVEEVARRAVADGATRYYWLAHEQNTAARGLYDKLARCHGYVRYDYTLPT
jgi:GNAT superfamily N-acetyltransferase